MAIANEKAKEEELRDVKASLKASMDEQTGKLKEELQEKVARVKELESELVLTETQFARAVAESEVSWCLKFLTSFTLTLILLPQSLRLHPLGLQLKIRI